MDLRCEEILDDETKKKKQETLLKQIKQEKENDDDSCSILPQPLHIIPETCIKKENGAWETHDALPVEPHLINIKIEDLSEPKKQDTNPDAADQNVGPVEQSNGQQYSVSITSSFASVTSVNANSNIQLSSPGTDVNGLSPAFPMSTRPPGFTPEHMAVAQNLMSPTSPFHNRPLVPFVTPDGKMVVPVPVPVPYHAMPPHHAMPPYHPAATHPYFFNSSNLSSQQQQPVTEYKLSKGAETKRKDRPYKCNRCERAYKRLNTLRLHQNVHDEKFKCPHCGKCFDQRTKLFEHLHTHSTTKPLYCNFCGKNFVQKGNLKTHQLKYHDEELKLLEEAGLTNHVQNLLEPIDEEPRRTKHILQPPEFITSIPPRSMFVRHRPIFTSDRNVGIPNGFHIDQHQTVSSETNDEDRPTFVIGNVTSLQRKLPDSTPSDVIDLTSDDNTEDNSTKEDESYEAAIQTLFNLPSSRNKQITEDSPNKELPVSNQDSCGDTPSEAAPISDYIDSEIIRIEDIPMLDIIYEKGPEIPSEDINTTSPSDHRATKEINVSDMIQMTITPNSVGQSDHKKKTTENSYDVISIETEVYNSDQMEDPPIDDNANEILCSQIESEERIKSTGANEIQTMVVAQPIKPKDNIKTSVQTYQSVPIFTTDTLGESFKCEQCQKCFSNLEYLKSHQRIHMRIYQCGKCDRSFELENSLRLHQNVHEEVFKCTECSKCFPQKGELTSHVRVHTRPFGCGLCGKSFAQNRDLKTHILWHRGNELFKCNECSKCFTQKASLKTHLDTHKGIKRFQCEVCSKSFSLKGNLQKHLDLHKGLKPFQCPLCWKCFTQKHALQRHLTLHNAAQPFECTICNKWFVKKESYQQHLESCKKMLLYNTYGNSVVIQQ